LAAEGLFDEARKRPLPRWPRRIGVVTSPTGAVWNDIQNVLRRRYPMVEVVLSPTAVQGGVSAPAIIRALKRVYAVPSLDLVILARGGGSIEDLWGFNDEVVVRTVIAAPVPVVVGVGHESDVTLADFAADRRAPTPSAAAEISVPDGSQLPAILNRLGERATAAASARLQAGSRTLRGEGRALAALRPDLATARQRAAELLDRSHRAATADLERRRLGVVALHDALRALGPLATLDRGYAVARRADGMIVRDPTELSVGDDLEVIVARGAVDTRVTTVRPGNLEELLP
jgi:exodeoxyribonuclease VII large subunit